MNELKFNRQRRTLFILVIGLSLFGLLMIYSASCISALKSYKDPAFFFKRQFVFFIFSLFLFFGTLFLNLDWFRKYNKELLLFTVILLIALFFVGKRTGGARRWFNLAGINLQPSEFLKVTFLFYACEYFVRKRMLMKSFSRGVLPLVIVVGFTSFLVVLQPDLGTVVFWLIWLFLMLFVVGVKKVHLFLLVIAGGVITSLLVLVQPYRMARLMSYLNPWADPKGSGFQLIQSHIAFGEGGFWGTGLGAGQQKFLFLPAAHTDFIFSIVGEEFGFFGAFILISVYFFIIVTMLNISLKLRDDFSRYACIGISLIIGLETVINTGVCCGLFPTKGMTLPFMSYGGTSLLVHFLLLGLFFNITKHQQQTHNLR